MDTFFATKKGGQSSRGHTCCQLFVTDKGFIYVVPMKKKSEVLLTIKQFAKEIGAPDSFVADMSGKQMSSEVKKFCNDIGTTLRALEEGTPWSNKAELYIGLIKEAVRKDMRETNSPLRLWDYCVERRARINNLAAKNAFKLHGSTPHTVTTGDEDQTLSSQKLSKNIKIMNKKNSQHLKLKTLLTLLASSSTSNQHMTKLSMLKSSYNLEKKWSMAK